MMKPLGCRDTPTYKGVNDMKRAKKIRPQFFNPELSRCKSKKLRDYLVTRNGKCYEYARPQLGIKA